METTLDRSNVLTRIRAVLRIGALWGAFGAAVGLAVGVVAGLVGVAPLAEALVVGPLSFGSLGMLLGSGFATALTLGERGRSFSEITPRRAAVWGGLGAAALPILALVMSGGSVAGEGLTLIELVLEGLTGVVVYAAVGAGLAAGSVAIAKRGERLTGDMAVPVLGGGSDEPEPGSMDSPEAAL